MFKIKIKEDEKVIFKTNFDKIEQADNIILDLKKKYKGGTL